MKKGTSNAPLILGIIGTVLNIPAAMCGAACGSIIKSAGDAGGSSSASFIGGSIIAISVIAGLSGLVGGILGKSNPSHTRVKNGTHNFQDSGAASTRNNKRINEGTHIFLGGKVQSQTANRQLQNGRHPSQLKKTCEYCGITCGSGQYNQWHGDKCKLRFNPLN